MSTQDKIIAIIAEQTLLAPADIDLNRDVKELGMDSTGLVECIFAIEEEFDVTIPFNANVPGQGVFDVTNVAAIVAGVEKLIQDRV